MIQVSITDAPEPREFCWDLENRPLAYWYDGECTSEITAFGWKWSDEKNVHSMLLRPDGTFEDDKGVRFPYRSAYEIFYTEIVSADLVFGHNIRRHDLPMLNANLWRLQLPLLPPLRTSDTCKDIPKKGGISVSLENLVSLYELGGTKFTMSQPMWEDANRLTESGIVLARKRVVSDVILQEKLRNKLKALGILKPAKTWTP